MADTDIQEDGLERRIEERRNIKHPLATTPVTVEPHGNIPNTPLAASTISFLLGASFALGFALFVQGGLASPWWATSQLGFFIAAWSSFHWGEFAVTAGWNLEKCSVDSFLLDNGATYHIANGTALVEYLVTLFFMPSSKSHTTISTIGILLVIAGQTLRTTAMMHAATNFSHAVAFRKQDTHQLVTDGVYGWCRHPSYAGFFYWALGTQMVLQNPVSFIGFAVVLWRFFYRRTRGLSPFMFRLDSMVYSLSTAEEKALVQFFGKDYEVYRSRVGTKIPFIP